MSIATIKQSGSRFNAARWMAHWITAPAVLIWLVAIGLGFTLLSEYKHAEGDRGAPPQQWPADVPLPAPTTRSTVLFFSHPHCPCTRAAFRELERILAGSTHPIDLQVIFVAAGSESQSPKSISLLSSASTLDPNTIAHDNGDIANRFCIKTSSHILLYDSRGRLQFSGGINPARGHDGGSAGGCALAALLQNRASDTTTAPVFGCPLFTPDPSCELAGCRE
jgi:hypothetical protein